MMTSVPTTENGIVEGWVGELGSFQTIRERSHTGSVNHYKYAER